MKAGGAHGKNANAVIHHEITSNSLAVQNQDAILDISPEISHASLIYLALGIVLRAKKKGWNTQQSPDAQFQAFCYLIDVLTDAIQGSTLKITSAPKWFWEICYALAPKEHSYVTARVYYEPIVKPTSLTLSSNMALGALAEAYNVVFGSPTGLPKNGFPTITPAPAYDPLIGAAEFSSMWNVFSSVKGTPTELVGPFADTALLRKDCSAFAMAVSRFGLSYLSPGGSALRLENEAHIDCPILSKFCWDYTNASSLSGEYRTGFQLYNSGGTPCYIGPRASEFEKDDQFRNKGRPVFKFYDINEFIEVFALLIGLMQQQQFTQASVVYEQYPLTIQQFSIMLRQAILPLFANEMAQDLRHECATPVDPGTPVYLPLVVSDNGVSLTAFAEAPLFPRFYTEMVKGCSRVTSNVGNLASDRLIMDWVPVLCKNPAQTLTGYTYDGEPVFLPAPPAEIPMNLVDCSIVEGPTVSYLCLNGPELAEYVTLHNKWMNNYMSFVTGLAKFAPSRGSPLFSSIFQTRVVRTVSLLPPPEPSPQVTAEKKKSKDDKSISSTPPQPQRKPSVTDRGYSVKDRIVKGGKGATPPPPVPGNAVFQFEETSSIHSNLPFLSELSKYQDILICPFIHTAASLSGTASYLQCVYGEGIKTSFGASPDGGSSVFASTRPSLYDTHLKCAQMDIKNVFGSSRTEIEVLLDELEAKGEGGFLSTLSKALSMGSSITKTIGDLTGF
jgi:hypothetical protein